MLKKLRKLLFVMILVVAASCTAQKSDVDVDLSKMSATAIYSEVYNMVTTPDEYIGKSVRMRGAFSSYYSPETDRVYCFCVIPDATACCQQGIEFVLAGDYTWPDDYPAEGDPITVKGIFGTYKEGKMQYCNLVDAELASNP